VTRFAYDDQLASIPAVVRGIIERTDIPALDPACPIVFTGIGTSLHAARVAADWVGVLTQGRVRALSVDAHDLGAGVTPLRPDDQVVVISHRGTKRYPNASLTRARALGCHTMAIVGESAPQQDADVTLRTSRNETSGTFSVSYQAALAILARVVAATFKTEAAEFAAALPRLPDALAATLAVPIDGELVTALSGATPILISGFGPDLVTAREAALKIKEGAWLWTEAVSPEFALHGTPASYHSDMSAIVMLPALDDGGRSRELVEVLRTLGLCSVVTCGENKADLGFALPPHPLLRPFLAILPFHRLTAELARVLGTDPDTLHGHREPWKTVMTELRL
jgi:glutamine---fructose-6-phosphate transaminase (isomerizing)